MGMVLPVLWLGEGLSPRPKAIWGRDDARCRPAAPIERRSAAPDDSLFPPVKLFMENEAGSKENLRDDLLPEGAPSLALRLKLNEGRREDSVDFLLFALSPLLIELFMLTGGYDFCGF